MPKILKTPENKRKANKKYHDKHREDLKVYCKQYRKDHPGLNVRYSYGLTLEQVDEMLINQDHKCLICDTALTETNRHIDHNHRTGKIRGILCGYCNTRLWSIENLEYHDRAHEYLDKYKENNYGN